MNEHDRQEDPAFDRLVAADPAERAPGPVQSVLRAKVDALIAGETEPAGTAGPAAGAPADEVALRRYRRRTPWLVAAAVAGIVAAGGGGYLAGERGAETVSAADSGAESADQAPSALSAPAGPEEPDEGRARGPEDGSVAGEPAPLDASGDLPAGTGLVFHAGVTLSGTPTTAQVRVAGEQGTSLGSYPVVSEVEAVDRLSDPRFAGAVLGSARDGRPPAPTGTTPVPGGPIVWPVDDVTIVSATLTTARYPLSDGQVLLVPAYDLSDGEGGRWTVLAVDEEHLDFAP